MYCGREGCKWLTDGNPRGSFAVPLSSTCDSRGTSCWPEAPPTMASFIYAWGDKPWSRTRALTLQVTIDGNLAPAPAAIACTGCTGACSGPSGPCSGTPPFVIRQFPGLLVYTATPQGALAGWDLVLEVDLGLAPPRARACRTHFSDSPSCRVKEPVCATEGTVTLNQSPCRSRLDDLKARFTARFPDGVMLEGTL
ncbi:MAG: hypothetical protein IT371_29710 [Deltaproteobacteria bacterium]|nr:hypothetical protein [Deltaproteobacteria bacterium]